MTIVLASASKSRAAVLSAAGVSFDAVPADVDEDAIKSAALGGSPEAMALALAEQKALAVSTKRPKSIVVGGDQILWFDGAAISKCPDIVSARTLLLRLRGRTHRLIGGLALAEAGAISWRHTSVAEIAMRDFSEAFLDSYLTDEGPAALSSVGVYRLEGKGAQLLASFKGSYFSVLGLDLLPLLGALRERGAIAA